MSDRFHALGRSTGTWLAQHPRIRVTLVRVAAVLGMGLLMVVIGATAEYTKDRVNEARARQVWALVVVGAGDPVELDRWESWGSCEAMRRATALDAFTRHGVAPALRCDGVKSWLELLKETGTR